MVWRILGCLILVVLGWPPGLTRTIRLASDRTWEEVEVLVEAWDEEAVVVGVEDVVRHRLEVIPIQIICSRPTVSTATCLCRF